MAQSILANTGIATTGRIINVALGLIVIKLVTHFLGPSGYGSYTLLVSFGTILQLVADSGLYLHLTRSIASEPQRQQEKLSAIFSLRLTLLVIIFLCGLGVVAFVPSLRMLKWPYVIIALGLSAQSLSQLYMGIFQYRQVVWRATLGDLMGRLAQIGTITLLGVKSAALSGMVAAFTIGSSVALLVHHLTTPIALKGWRLRYADSKSILAAAWPMGLLLLLNAVYFRIDTVILSFFRSAPEVGWYGLAYRIVESALFFPAMFGGLLLPRLTEAFARHDIKKLQAYVTQGLTLQLIAAGFIIVTLFMKAEAIIIVIADASFLPAAPLLRWLGIALVSMFFGNVFGFVMIALQKQMTLLKLYAALALANTLGNIVLIPQWGAPAAAVTTVITEVSAMLSVAWIIYQQIPYRISRHSFIGTIIASGAAASIYLATPHTWPLVVQVALSGATYLLVLAGVKVIRPDMLSLLTSSATTA